MIHRVFNVIFIVVFSLFRSERACANYGDAKSPVGCERDEKEHGVIHERDVVDEEHERIVQILDGTIKVREYYRYSFRSKKYMGRFTN